MGRKWASFCSFALVGAFLAQGGAAAPAQASTPVYLQSVIETAHVPMRDGATLFVQIKRPVVPPKVRVPIILTLSPYNDIETSPAPPDVFDAFDSLASRFVPRGYARAIADVRGTRESTGCWDYGGAKERHDGYDLVEWLGRRPWSNGRVAMIGASYDGTTANMTAIERPPHLATIVPIAAIDRWYDYAYLNGVRWAGNDEQPTDEGIDTPAGFDFGLVLPPPVDARASTFAESFRNRYTPCDQVAHTQHGYNPQPDYDAFWTERDYLATANRVTIPVLIGQGLDDYNVKAAGAIALYRKFAGPKRLVIGQWPHANPTAAGAESWDSLLTRWFDRYLLGLKTGVEKDKPVDVEDSTGTWHREIAWPPPSARKLEFAIAGSRLVETKPQHGGVLSSPSTFFDDPTMTEQRAMQGQTDPARLLFMGDPASRAERITGEPALKLTMSSNMPSTHVTALLADLAPDGSWVRITRGFFNPRYRNGPWHGEDMASGQYYSFRFTLAPADHILKPGHQLVLSISSSDAVWAVPDPLRAMNSLMEGQLDLRVI